MFLYFLCSEFDKLEQLIDLIKFNINCLIRTLLKQTNTRRRSNTNPVPPRRSCSNSGQNRSNYFYHQQKVEKSELQIWSLQIAGVQRILARNWVLAFLKYDQSTQYG